MVQQSFKKKLEGAAINGMVLSVNEVPDGHAGSILNDVSTELQKLRTLVACTLALTFVKHFLMVSEA